MRRLLIAAVFVALPAAAALVWAQGPKAATGAARPPASASGLDLSAIDRSVEPCTDFFQFACGAWIKEHPIPADCPRWGSFDAVQEHNLDILHTILEDAAAGR